MVYLRLLTIVFGALPATWLCIWAAYAIMLGAAALLGGAVAGAVIIVWGVAGMYGTAGLWGIGLGFVGPGQTKQLIVGVIAILPVAIAVDPLNLEPNDFLNPLIVSAILPLIVATIWLAVIWRQKRKDRAVRHTELRTAR